MQPSRVSRRGALKMAAVPAVAQVTVLACVSPTWLLGVDPAAAQPASARPIFVLNSLDATISQIDGLPATSIVVTVVSSSSDWTFGLVSVIRSAAS